MLVLRVSVGNRSCSLLSERWILRLDGPLDMTLVSQFLPIECTEFNKEELDFCRSGLSGDESTELLEDWNDGFEMDFLSEI